MTVDRIYVLQQLIKKTHAKTYLEIGVYVGDCFLRIKCGRKIAVDPQISISFKKKRKFFFRNYHILFNRYFEMTSDDFFHKQQELLLRTRPGIVFIDGLHTYEQSLKDVQNALNFLRDGGMIIMHDCNPLTEAAAFPAQSFEHAKSLNIPGFAGEWNGDVWKTILHLRSNRHDLNIFVLDCDEGLGIITKGVPGNTLHFSPEEIQGLSYRDLDANRERFLNLRNLEYFHEFVQAR